MSGLENYSIEDFFCGSCDERDDDPGNRTTNITLCAQKNFLYQFKLKVYVEITKVETSN